MPSDSLSTWDDNPPVVLGTHVLLELIDEHGARERYEFDMTPDSASDFDAGLLGLGTPLGKAIAGKKAGAIVDLKRVTACRIDINARDDGDACLDEAVCQPSRATEKINTRDLAHFLPLWVTRLLSR